jgi:hypothetical protein
MLDDIPTRSNVIRVGEMMVRVRVLDTTSTRCWSILSGFSLVKLMDICDFRFARLYCVGSRACVQILQRDKNITLLDEANMNGTPLIPKQNRPIAA